MNNDGTVTLMIFDGYGSEAKAIVFADETRARDWAGKYLEAFAYHKAVLVFGRAEVLKAEEKTP